MALTVVSHHLVYQRLIAVTDFPTKVTSGTEGVFGPQFEENAWSQRGKATGHVESTIARFVIFLLLSEDLRPCSGATYIRVGLSPQLTQSKNSLWGAPGSSSPR